MKRVLVLGGYGGFGARLSRRLAVDGWTVIVAGRNLAKARQFAASLPGAEVIRADRESDLGPVLEAIRADLLIDAAGPFQGSSYRVAEACIAAGVHYTDLADARGFVCGIGALDEAARRAGVSVVSGGSTVPALTGAVLRELAAPLDRLDAVDIALGASTRATGGASIAAAALSYAGKPIRTWRHRRWEEAHGLHSLERRTFRIAGLRPVARWVALAEVPDLELVPDRFAGRPATLFRAGNESAPQMGAARVLAGAVRRGWLGSLGRAAPILLPLQRALGRSGSARSAMGIEVKGWRGGEALLRRWTVIAEHGDGPEIPVLAAQLVARRLREGGLGSGAYDSSRLFTLADFAPLLSELHVVHTIKEEPLVPLYERAMGPAYARLPDAVRAMHSIAGDGASEGEGRVERGTSPLARLLGAVMRFPPAGEYPVRVCFTEREGEEHWVRHFGPHRFESRLRARRGGVTERFGPLRFHFDLRGGERGLSMVLRHWTALGLPLPLALAPRIEASESADGQDFLFDVRAATPFGGTVVHYRGRLRRVAVTM